MRHISHPEGQFPDHTKTGARGRVTPSYCSSQLPWWAWNAVSVCMVVICCFRKTKVKSFFPHHVAECMHACCHVSPVPLFMTLWTVTCQALLSTGFSRQEHWSGLPRLPPGDLPDPGIQSMSLRSPTLAGGLLTTSATGKPIWHCTSHKILWRKGDSTVYVEMVRIFLFKPAYSHPQIIALFKDRGHSSSH